uniref:Myotubularin-related protein 2 n=1 Tax=Hirondellea gigas TaxID=1518452 RepID=A0A6A7G540_9CRUS
MDPLSSASVFRAPVTKKAPIKRILRELLTHEETTTSAAANARSSKSTTPKADAEASKRKSKHSHRRRPKHKRSSVRNDDKNSYRESPRSSISSASSSSSTVSSKSDLNDSDVKSIVETICEENVRRGNLIGEKLVMRLEVRYLHPTLNSDIPGVLVMTNYQLFFEPQKGHRIPSGFNAYNTHCPLSTVERIVQVGQEKNDRSVYALDIYTRQLRLFRFLFGRGSDQRNRAYNVLMQYVFPQQSKLLFAYSHLEDRVFPSEFDGWKMYDATNEFVRMGIPSKTYRLSLVNVQYGLCQTYPRLLAVPTNVPDTDLFKVSGFRKRGRIPVLTWKHPVSEASIWRCSQPKVGLSMRCHEDEVLLKAINNSNPDNDTLYVMDARPKINAHLNRIGGAGYELVQHYGQCRIRFLNIENIHIMRDSIQKLGKVLSRVKADDTDWVTQVEGTNYLKHIRGLLQATFTMISIIDRHKASIVSHCSDGWDRTTQLCALTELCLDPYYRSRDGFIVLIEKEWLSYGHQFQLRTGHGDKNYTALQRSPIFHQFIESVWNLTEQFPTSFEFTSAMLVTILDHLYSCRFGTFLFNSERERRQEKLATQTMSLWTYIRCCPSKENFLNPFYDPKSAGPVLYPTFSPKKVWIWQDYWLRWSNHEVLHGGIGQGSIPPFGATSSTLCSKDSALHAVVRRHALKVRELQAILLRMEKERHQNKARSPRLKSSDPSVSDNVSSALIDGVHVPGVSTKSKTKLLSIPNTVSPSVTPQLKGRALVDHSLSSVVLSNGHQPIINSPRTSVPSVGLDSPSLGGFESVGDGGVDATPLLAITDLPNGLSSTSSAADCETPDSSEETPAKVDVSSPGPSVGPSDMIASGEIVLPSSDSLLPTRDRSSPEMTAPSPGTSNISSPLATKPTDLPASDAINNLHHLSLASPLASTAQSSAELVDHPPQALSSNPPAIISPSSNPPLAGGCSPAPRSADEPVENKEQSDVVDPSDVESCSRPAMLGVDAPTAPAEDGSSDHQIRSSDANAADDTESLSTPSPHEPPSTSPTTLSDSEPVVITEQPSKANSAPKPDQSPNSLRPDELSSLDGSPNIRGQSLPTGLQSDTESSSRSSPREDHVLTSDE